MKENNSSICFAIFLAFIALVARPAFCATAEPQSKQAKEAKALVDKAAALVQSKGKDAFPQFRKKGGAWFKGDLYLFIDDFDGNVLVYPPDRKLEGENIKTMKDASGKLIIQTYVDALKTQDSAWVEYMWPRPGTDKPAKKLSYLRKTKIPNGATVIIGAGVYVD